MLRRRVGKEEEEEPNHNLNHNHEVQPSSDSSSRDNSQSKSQFKSKSDTDSPAAARPSHSKRSESFIHKPRSKRRNGLIFALGGLFGVLVAVLFANQQDVISLDSLMDFNIESLMEVMPHGFLNDAREFTQHERDTVNYDPFSVGLHLQAQGFQAKHPMVMIPGVISTGLESWGTEPASRQYFRKRLWGSWSMMRALVLDKQGWKNHIMLDKDTGLDPPGIKLRAAQGFDATDFFITGYWIWNKILENLATIGYDPTNAFTAAYDWRLSYPNMEVRDQYFSRLKSYIETAVQVQGEKVTLASHSMGSQVVLYFFKWVENPEHGKGGSDWVNRHVANWINISGCMLGAVKGLTAVLSGEMRDTAQLNAFAVYGLEKFLSKEERAEIFRAMPGISSMLPKGGEAVWGNATWAPDDQPHQNLTYGNLLNFRESGTSRIIKNMTITESLNYLLDEGEDWYRHQVLASYSHGVAHTAREVEANEHNPRTWLNPLEARLPLAPDMKIYCFYGVGKPTERSYFYQEERDPLVNLNVSIDTTVTNNDGVDHGVHMGEGDGTVNLLSTGYMCAKGWHIKRYNPAGVKIKVFEMPHEPDRFSPRGGPNTGDHVDILGRASLNDLILRVAAGQGDHIEETYVSNIREYAERVQIFDDE
ncbi:phospholipid:diacylglycerol acyltransferase [Aspergillus fijiensis CBS 313.89]|uniref:Phospholipid:diacylglycerol acyltransferase n=1 Tax=Aspergillus fijiensis CBS 313.89 TaxID=1448319 RepID=A0A8G1W0N9_9EURO|nr:phospholipid:diacylglycerol acyltransferase [Aspergillus fijiensis CBS 313.89]RAK78783.1 phospholipid:diacylglycerol acyltransferase [Aspergillus fijiensis CBS 313.89]